MDVNPYESPQVPPELLSGLAGELWIERRLHYSVFWLAVTMKTERRKSGNGIFKALLNRLLRLLYVR